MNSTCHCIALRRAARRITSSYDEALLPAGVNLAQYSLLQNIGRLAPVSLTELGRMTELDRSTIGRNVKVLVRMGLAQTSVGADLREATASLTEDGERVLLAAATLWSGAQKKIDSALGQEGSTQLQTLLAAI